MKITRLRMAGFGPYKTEQVIDFTSFDDDGIFLITGATGAGKSSILDAICYALYDQVPRYDQRAAQLRSDHCEPTDPTFVELEFTLGDFLYRVHRTPKFERPKQRGGGMAIAQKNSTELLPRRAEMATDFAVSEECNQYDECDDYLGTYGDAVLMIEYTDDAFAAGCAAYPQVSIVRRDLQLTTPGDPNYVYDAC